MADKFANHSPSLTSPAGFLFTVVPDDAQDLAQPTKAIHLNEAGDVRITGVDQPDGQFVTLRNIPVGVPYPIRAKRIWAAGTSSSDIVGLA